MTPWSPSDVCDVTYRIKVRFVIGEENLLIGSELEVTPAASRRSRDSDRQLQLSLVAQIQRSSISHKPQTDIEIALIFFLTRPRFLQNCAWIEFYLEGTGEQTAHVLYTERQYLAAVGFSSHALCNTKKKGNLPCLRSPPVSRRAVYLPVYRHSTLNILSNRGRFPSKAGLVWRQQRKAWKCFVNNISHPYTLSATTQA